MSNQYFNVGDEIQYHKCGDCGDVIWTEHDNHGITCICGGWLLRGDEVIIAGKEGTITEDELQAIYDVQQWPTQSPQT